MGGKELRFEAGLGLGHLSCFRRHGSDIAGVPLLFPILYPCTHKSVSAPQRMGKTPACQTSTWILILMPCPSATWFLKPHTNRPPGLQLGITKPLGLLTCPRLP